VLFFGGVFFAMPVDPRFVRNLAHQFGATEGGGLFLVDATETFDGEDNAKALHALYISRLCCNLLQIVRRTDVNTKQFDKLLDFLKRDKIIPSRIQVIAIYGTSILFLGATVSMARSIVSLKSMIAHEEKTASDDSFLEIAIHAKTLEAMIHSQCPRGVVG
jgi:hypothetical protein